MKPDEFDIEYVKGALNELIWEYEDNIPHPQENPAHDLYHACSALRGVIAELENMNSPQAKDVLNGIYLSWNGI